MFSVGLLSVAPTFLVLDLVQVIWISIPPGDQHCYSLSQSTKSKSETSSPAEYAAGWPPPPHGVNPLLPSVLPALNEGTKAVRQSKALNVGKPWIQNPAVLAQFRHPISTIPLSLIWRPARWQ
eukprot:2748698-Amphidinium_carterae.2